MTIERSDHPAHGGPAVGDWRSRLNLPRGVVMTPTAEVDPRDEPASPTAYVPDRLLLSLLPDDAEKSRARLEEVAIALGWSLQSDDFRVSLGDTDATRAERVRRYPWATGELAVVRYRIVADGGAAAPDAWELLTRARRGHGPLRGASLDHLLSVTGGFHSTPFHSTGGFHSTPFHSTGWDPSAGASPIGAYAVQGSGGRQPVGYVGPAPVRDGRDAAVPRPLVGTLDTGCGAHPWLTGALQAFAADPALAAIGDQGAAAHPELDPDLIGPLDGMVDPVAGHGTFIAGLVHQACPDADLAPWRIMPPDGVAEESEVLAALGAIADHVETALAKQGRGLDVLSLSFGYYHETPKDELTDVTMSEFLVRIRRTGTVVVCSAGNDATARPMYPAAFGHWAPAVPGDDEVPAIVDVDDAAPLVSVGALNPGGHTVALFSNAGRWVRTHEIGAAVLSTMPAWGGGAAAVAATAGGELERATIDPDDFGGGFALWSGTSFAAPLVAGRIAAVIDRLGIPAGGETSADRIARAIAAVDEIAPLHT